MKWEIKTREDRIWLGEINLTDKDLYHLQRMTNCYWHEMNEVHDEDGVFTKREMKRMEQTCDSLLLLVEAMIKGASVSIKS